MVAIQRLCIAVLVMLVCVQASWITAVRMMFRPRRSAAPTTRVISEIEELKQQLAIMHEQTAALKRMVRSSKQHVQVFRKEMETLQRAHRLELQAMGDQYIANEDELRNDLLSGSEEELRTVVKELENKNELEKQQLVANMTNAHNRELASLRVTLRQCEKTLYENEHIIKDLKAELLESSRRHSLQREHEVSLHEQELSALREELSQKRTSQSPQVLEETVSFSGDNRDASETSAQTADYAATAREAGAKRSVPRGSRRMSRKHSSDTGGDGHGSSNSLTSRGLKSSRVNARGNSPGGR